MALRIAMLGLYGGLAREWNPGSFMIGWQTVRELRRRLGRDVVIDLYCMDTGGEYDDVRVETEDDLAVHFFCKHKGQELVEQRLSRYDALVVGGDNVWSTSDPSSIFFAKNATTRVLFHCVSTIRPRESILALRETIVDACERAKYVSVRSTHLHEVLARDLGLAGVVHCPDPVLAHVPIPHEPILPPKTKPRLGVSVSPPLVNALADAFRALERELEQFEVVLYAWTSLYHQMESAHRLKRAFGFRAIERPLSPLEAFGLIGELDISFNDTYHGTIAAIVHGTPFITIRHREGPTSRRTELAALLGMDDESIPILGPRPGGIAVHVPLLVAGTNVTMVQPEPGRHADDVARLTSGLQSALRKPRRAPPEALAGVRARIDAHFDAMVKHL